MSVGCTAGPGAHSFFIKTIGNFILSKATAAFSSRRQYTSVIPKAFHFDFFHGSFGHAETS
jgi:hypothetical protein